MSVQLTADEIIEAMQQSDHPRMKVHKAALEALVTAMAHDLADHIDIDAGKAEYMGRDLAGLCVPFQPRHRNQKMPDCLIGFDPEAGWDEEAAEIKPWGKVGNSGFTEQIIAEETTVVTFAENANYAVMWADRSVFEIIRKADGASIMLSGKQGRDLAWSLKANTEAYQEGKITTCPVEIVCLGYDHLLK